MMPGTDPRKERVKRRARACLCIAMGAMLALVLTRPGWTWVPAAFVIAVSVISPIAAAGGLPGGLRGLAAAGAAAPAGAAEMMMLTGPPARPRTGGTCWS